MRSGKFKRFNLLAIFGQADFQSRAASGLDFSNLASIFGTTSQYPISGPAIFLQLIRVWQITKEETAHLVEALTIARDAIEVILHHSQSIR